MSFIEYITVQGDRLDLIAYRAYGNPFRISGIVSANPTMPIQASYDGGMRILIPIVEVPENSNTIKNLLPPWKR